MATGNHIAKGWFLTYPQCELKKEEVLSILSTNFSKQKIVEYVIAEEKHADGSPHIHAFVKFDKKVKFSKKFDLMSFHGNYSNFFFFLD